MLLAMNDLVRVWFVVMFVIGMAGLAACLVVNLLWIYFRGKQERRSNEQYWKQRLQRNKGTPLQV